MLKKNLINHIKGGSSHKLVVLVKNSFFRRSKTPYILKYRFEFSNLHFYPTLSVCFFPLRLDICEICVNLNYGIMTLNHISQILKTSFESANNGLVIKYVSCNLWWRDREGQYAEGKIFFCM